MAYTKIIKGGSGDASIINDNFVHIGSGIKYPRGGDNLEQTTGVYDLGHTTYRWNNAYVGEIDFTGDISNTWQRISTTDVNSATSRIEITGLNGDTDIQYMIIGYIYSSITTMYILNINGDSGTNYGGQVIHGGDYGLGTTITAWRNTGQQYWEIGETHYITITANLSFFQGILFAKTGYERTMIHEVMNSCGETYISAIRKYGQIWNNTTSTITSLVFTTIVGPSTGVYGAGTHIDIYARR